MSRLMSINGFFYPWLLLHKEHDMWDTIYKGPWIIDGVDFYSQLREYN